MSSHISVRPITGTWVIRAGGAIIGESKRAVELIEGSYSPVVYFPRDDVAMAFLEKTSKTSTCPHKGVATYYSIIAKSGEIEDAAWSYEAPIEGVGSIAGYLAFYPDKAAVEEV